jgi:hypothetical protein
VIGLVLGLGTFVVRDVAGLLRHPFWLDEAWVALSTRASLVDLHRFTASTPLLFALLLRPAAALGDQVPRLVPLIFAAATVVVAAVLAGHLPWPNRGSRLLAAGAAGGIALLAPTVLMRNDLKQYTADAFFALLAFLLCSRVEAHRTTGRLVALAAMTGFSPLIGVAGAFAGFACLTAVALIALLDGDGRFAARAAAATLGAVVLAAAIYLVTFGANLTPSFQTYWQAYFLEGGPWTIATSVWDSFVLQRPGLGLGPTATALALVLLGVGTLVRVGRPALALAFVGLWIEMILLGVLDRYPFLDARTSHFLLLLTGVVGMVGFAGLVAALSERWPVAPLVGAIVGLALWLPVVDDHLRELFIPNEDPRSSTRYVEQHRAPNDVVLVSYPGSYGFAYYWRPDAPAFDMNEGAGPGFLPAYPVGRGIIVAPDRTPDGVANALAEAVEAAAARGGRVWLVRSHVIPAEAQAWQDAANARGVRLEQVCMTDLVDTDDGPRCADSEPLLVATPAAVP